MSEEEILEKAIQKAIDGGYEGYPARRYVESIVLGEQEFVIDQMTTEGDEVHWKMFIFDHDFAKALWGEEWPINQAFKRLGVPWWKEHLQQMVIAEDPIKYLGDNL